MNKVEKVFRRSRSLPVVFLLAAVAATGFALEDSSSRGEQETTVTVQGIGTAEAEPDLLIVDVGVTIVDRSALSASQEARARMQRIFRALSEMGIPEDQVETTNLSIYTEHQPGRGGPEEPETRYRAQNMVRVRSKDVEEAGPLIDTLVKNGANQLMGVRFAVDDEREYLERARRAAVRDAMRSAESIAEELGMRLGRVLRVSDESGGPPRPFVEAMAGRGGGNGTPVAPGAISFTEEVTVVFSLEPAGAQSR